jgi:hypothetical protein
MRFGKSCREKYFHREIVSENGYLSCKIIVTSQISDRENQMEPSRGLRIGERNGRLYSRIVEELDRERLIEPRSIYYDCLVEKTNQKPRNQRRNRLGN